MRIGRTVMINNLLLTVLLLMLILLMNNCTQKRGFLVLDVEYYSDSISLKSIGYTNGNGKQGEWYSFDEQGKITEMATYLDDVLDGEYVQYKCCLISYKAIMKDGLVKDKITFYSPNGYIENITRFNGSEGFEFSFKDGVLNRVTERVSDDSLKELYSNEKLVGDVPNPKPYGCCQKFH